MIMQKIYSTVGLVLFLFGDIAIDNKYMYVVLLQLSTSKIFRSKPDFFRANILFYKNRTKELILGNKHTGSGFPKLYFFPTFAPSVQVSELDFDLTKNNSANNSAKVRYLNDF